MGTEDETSLAYINSKYTLIGEYTYVVGDTDPEDHVVPITPYLCVNAPSGGLIPTTAGYIGSRFQFWRGDMKFLIYPVISPVTRGALQFIWQPVPDDSPTSQDFTNVSINSIVELEPARPIEIKVGFNNDYPACNADFYKFDAAITPADYRTLNGYLRIRNIVPLTGSVCGQEVRVLVFAAAGENMEFFGPTDTVFIDGQPFTFGHDLICTSLLQSQSGTVGAAGQGLLSIDLVPSSGPYPVAANLAGEQIKSVRALAQKPSSWYPDLTDHVDIWYGVVQTAHGPFQTDKSWNNYFKFYGTMFLGFAGSIRHKWITRLDNTGEGFDAFEALPAFIPEQVPNNYRVGGLPLGEWSPIVTNESVTAEYTVPYYHQELYVAAYKEPNQVDSLVWENATAERGRFAWYRSAGPDARWIYFRAQNKFVIVDPREALEPLVWQTAVNHPYEPGRLAKDATTMAVDKRQSWYRARTGRDVERSTPYIEGAMQRRAEREPLENLVAVPL